MSPARHKFAQFFCSLPLILAPLLSGTAARPYTMLIAMLCGVSGIWAAVECIRRERQVAVSWFTLAFLGLLCVCLLQLLPLPPALRSVLSPGSDQTLRQVLRGLSLYPMASHPLSVDPAGTMNEAVRAAGSLCLLLSLGVVFSHRGDAALLTRMVGLIAGGVAILGLLAAIGVVLPPPIGVGGVAGALVTRARLPAGFLNANHMAALMAVGAILLLAEIAHRYRKGLFGLQASIDLWISLGYLLVWVVVNVALLGTLSRGGVAVGLIGQGAILVRSLLRRSAHKPTQIRSLLPLLLLPIVLVGLYFVLAQEARQELSARFAATDVSKELMTPGSKLQAWVQALPLIRGHFLFGVGRGAFENAFQGVNTLSSSTRFPYLENEWLQLVVDIGVLPALCFFALVLLGMRNGLRRLRRSERREGSSEQRAAALVALSALALHNLVDFNLQVGGVALSALALCCVSSMGAGRFSLHPSLLLGFSLGLCGASGYCLLSVPSHEEDGRMLAVMAQDPKVSAEDIEKAGIAALARHPLDSYLPAVVAARLYKEGRPRAVSWLNRSLLANQRDVGAQTVSALLLAEAGHRVQAVTALLHVIKEANFPQRRLLFETALRITKDAEEFSRILPFFDPQEKDPRRRAVTKVLYEEALEVASGTGRWDVVRRLVPAAESLGVGSATYFRAHAAYSVKDVEGALLYGNRLLERAKKEGESGPLPGLLLSGIGGLLLESNRPAEAEAFLRTALVRGREVGQGPLPEVSITLSAVVERKGAITEARVLLDKALVDTSEPQGKALLHDARAALEERQGNLARAEEERAHAARLRTQ